VRNGLLEGQSIENIVRRAKGRLNREQRGSIDTIIAAGGQATSIPNNQIRAIVRTSVNQVSVAADRIVAAENPDVTEKYRYTATLDTKTSAICRALDGKVFVHGKGPYPPQHFNCRSRYVNIPTGLEKEFENIRDDYGEWLNEQDDSVKKDVLGPGRLALWDGLVKKYGASDAIRKFVGKDGSELNLDQLKRRYSSGKAS
jgi:SPP1 gp7 family putative phage head morphogenesis protein